MEEIQGALDGKLSQRKVKKEASVALETAAVDAASSYAEKEIEKKTGAAINLSGASKYAQSVYSAVQPALNVLLPLLEKALPHILAAWAVVARLRAKLAPYQTEEATTIVYGLVLVFFGSNFALLLAAIEAFKKCGWESTRDNVRILYQEFMVILKANEEDNARDDDADGIPDVAQIDNRAVLIRKALLFMRTSDPDRFANALLGIYTAFMGVIAVLKLKFAQIITLGLRLGDIFFEAVNPKVTPALKAQAAEEYHGWISLGVEYVVKSVAITVAFVVQRILTAMYSAMRGAEIAVGTALQLAAQKGVLNKAATEKGSLPSNFAVGLLVVVGIYFQLATLAGGLSFPLNILLLPLTLAESTLAYLVSFM